MEKDRLYPKVPNAPSDYRLQRINEIEKFLKDEVITRQKLYKKYKKSLSVMRVVDGVCISIGTASTAASLALVATGVGMPIAVGVQGMGIGAGVLAIIGKILEKKLAPKATKHNEIRILAEAKLNSISGKVAKAFEDGCISDEEYRSITAEQNEFITMRKDVESKTRKQLNTEITEQENKDIINSAFKEFIKNGN